MEGEEVEIPACTYISFDIAETPLLKSLTINGRLDFLNLDEPVNRTINTHWIHIRAGEFLIGSEEKPYNGEATVLLHGAPNDEAVAFSVFIEAGNKVIVNTNLMAMYGQPRDRMTRLRSTAFKDDTTIRVETGLDWHTGDRISIFPTAMHEQHFDYRTIDSYDSATGIVTLTEALDFYHFGKATSTAADYQGVDMRGEVVLLSRNVRIVGNDTDWWGGQILVADNLELVDMKQRSGQLIMDNVEVYNCS